MEQEESAVPHREGARRMAPNKFEACRKEIATLLEYDMIEPSKPPWPCGVVMAKKKENQLRLCCDLRYLNSVTVKDAYPIPRIDESLSKLEVFLRAGIVPMEEDALWPLQRNSHISVANGTGTKKCDEDHTSECKRYLHV